MAATRAAGGWVHAVAVAAAVGGVDAAFLAPRDALTVAAVFAGSSVSVAALLLPLSRWLPSAALLPMGFIAVSLPLWRLRAVPNEAMTSPWVWGACLLFVLVGAALWRVPALAVGPALAALGLVAALLRLGPASRATGSGPDVLLVTLDTTRADRLDATRMPALSRLAAAGTTYPGARAPSPQTSPAHLSMLTGRDVYEHGIYANGQRIGPQPRLLSQRMKARGYATGAVVSGYPLHRRFGFDQGFDTFDDDFGALPGLHDLTVVRWADVLFRGSAPRERRGDLTTARALAWIETAPRPWFAWVHYYDPHAPYDAPDDAAGPPPTGGEPLDLPQWWPAVLRSATDPSWIVARYDAEVAWTDRQLSTLFAHLHEGTIVAVVGDHGEGLGEHGVWFDHGDWLDEPALAVPMVVGRVGGTGRSVVEPCPISTRHLAGMIEAELDGVAWSCPTGPIWSSTVASREPSPPVHHVRRDGPGEGAEKVHYQADGTAVRFNLEADPGEVEPVPLGATQLPVEAAPAGSRTEDALLRALGYL